MRYPEFLPDGGTIGFVAPSFGCAMEPYRSAFAHSLDRWRAWGYRTLLGPNVYASEGIGISSTPEKCGEELTEAYVARESDVLIACGGGELMCETMDHVDFHRIREAEPKWYMGYSDNTNMTFLLATLCDTAAIYGPCAPAFGMEPLHPALTDALQVLRGEKLTMTGYDRYETEPQKSEENPLAPYHVTQKRHIVTYRAGRGFADARTDPPVVLEGRLLGGCLDCLVNLTGTDFDRVKDFAKKYRKEGILWFLEACDLNTFGIRRALWHLAHAGWFSQVKGFLIGRPLAGREPALGLDEYRAAADILGQFDVPILMDLDIGHLPPMMPLIVGARAHVTCQGQNFTLRMTCD